MATQTWPSGSIPSSPLYGSYSETPMPQVSEFAADVGPPSRWPRSASALLEVSFRVFLNATQRAALRTFYVQTCAQGVHPFTMEDPIDGSTYTWFWMQPPTVTTVGTGDQFNAELRLRRLVAS